MKTKGVKKRKVQFIGVCGPSASGKSTVTKRICQTVGSPILPVQADWFFKNVLPSCPIRKHCWEQPASVDSAKLATQLDVIRKKIEGAGFTTPSITIDGTKDKKRCLDAEGCVGKKLKHGTIWVIVEGFLLFADKKVVEKLTHCLWLDMDGKTGTVRRYKREGGKDPCDSSNPAFKKFRDERYMGHIYPHYLEFKGMQLANAGKKLLGRIDVSPPIEEVAGTAVKIISKAIGTKSTAPTHSEAMSTLKGYFSKKKKFKWVKPSKKIGGHWWLSPKGMHEADSKGVVGKPASIEMLGGCNFLLWKWGHVYMLNDKTGDVFVHTGKEEGITHVARAAEASKDPMMHCKEAKPDEKRVGWIADKVVPSSVWGTGKAWNWRWDTRHDGPKGKWQLTSSDGSWVFSERKEVDGKEVKFSCKVRFVTPTAFIVPKLGHVFLLDRKDAAVRVWNGKGLKYSASPSK